MFDIKRIKLQVASNIQKVFCNVIEIETKTLHRESNISYTERYCNWFLLSKDAINFFSPLLLLSVYTFILLYKFSLKTNFDVRFNWQIVSGFM